VREVMRFKWMGAEALFKRDLAARNDDADENVA
jgi:hypothetical protein